MESTKTIDRSLNPIFHDIRNMRYLTTDQLDRISAASDTDKMQIIQLLNDVLNWVVDNIVDNDKYK